MLSSYHASPESLIDSGAMLPFGDQGGGHVWKSAPIRHKELLEEEMAAGSEFVKGAGIVLGTIGVGFTAYDVCKWSDNE